MNENQTTFSHEENPSDQYLLDEIAKIKNELKNLKKLRGRKTQSTKSKRKPVKRRAAAKRKTTSKRKPVKRRAAAKRKTAGRRK